MEKKEKRKPQSQKELKPELVSPVSQEVPFNKVCSKNTKGMKRSLNKKRTGTPGIKRKRARLSSCSSEPLCPDEHCSTASTPTTPKVSSAASLPEVPESFSTSVTPLNNPEKRGKKSREEKKLQVYLRQIEKMEKKEKRKQQSQKQLKPELVSPVSQEVPFNKLCSKNMKGVPESFSTSVTPSTSPNGSFRFPKNEKQVKLSNSQLVH